MTSIGSVKQVDFQIHANLIEQWLRRQAGSLWKAVIEGIMNCIDAQASSVHVTLTRTQVMITDDGKGFRGHEEIKKFFQTIGQPPEVGELKMYGEYRMGRGQLFSFGRNEWRSGKFRMCVDINRNSKGFELEDKLEAVLGCTVIVSLYRQLSNLELADTYDEIARNAKYVTTPTFLNEKKINKPPAQQTWDLELAEADIKFRSTGNLVVYNRGIRVMDIPYYKYGIGGDVVSKKRLRVNFARNDLMSDCPVWKKIAGYLMRRGNVDRARRVSTGYQTSDDRQTMATRLKAGLLNREAKNRARVYTSIAGTHATINSLANRKYKKRVTLGRLDDWVFGRSLMRDKITYVVHPMTLVRFNVDTLAELVDIIHEQYGDYHDLKVLDYDEVKEKYGGEHEIITTEDLTLLERAILEALNYAWDWVTWSLCRTLNISREITSATSALQIYTGRSSVYDAWTDSGLTFICINRNQLTKYGNAITAFHRYVTLLLEQIIPYLTTDQMRLPQATVQRHLNMVLMNPEVVNFTLKAFCYLPAAYDKLERRATRTTLKRIDAIDEATQRNQAIADANQPGSATTQ